MLDCAMKSHVRYACFIALFGLSSLRVTAEKERGAAQRYVSPTEYMQVTSKRIMNIDYSIGKHTKPKDWPFRRWIRPQPTVLRHIA